MPNEVPDPVPLFGPEMVADPFPLYDQLREVDPVHWSEKFHAWIVTRFNEVVAGLNDLRSPRTAQALSRLGRQRGISIPFSHSSSGGWSWPIRPNTRLRSLVCQAFTPHVVEAMRPHIQRIVDDLLAKRRDAGAMDVIADFAFPLPATVIIEMLGLQPEDRDQLKSWSDDFVVFFSTHPADVTLDQYRQASPACEPWSTTSRCHAANPGERPSGVSWNDAASAPQRRQPDRGRSLRQRQSAPRRRSRNDDSLDRQRHPRALAASRSDATTARRSGVDFQCRRGNAAVSRPGAVHESGRARRCRVAARRSAAATLSFCFWRPPIAIRLISRIRIGSISAGRSTIMSPLASAIIFVSEHRLPGSKRKSP